MSREEQQSAESLLQVRDLVKHYPIREGIFVPREVGRVRAVDGVSFNVHESETLALVGESGCGKSTTGRLILRLIATTSGQIDFMGHDLIQVGKRALRTVRRDLQIVFQDPYASLDPRLRVEDIIAEPLESFGLLPRRKERRERVHELLHEVGLSSYHADRYPHQFSGGQRQRIGIARALAVEPKLIVADEPVSALDVSTQSQIINLMQDLQERHGLSFLFISHDLTVVKHIAHRVAVMYLGKIVEIADKQSLYRTPHHPYTQALLSAVPKPDPSAHRQRIILKDDVPSASRIPTGCRFHTRCPLADAICREQEPPLKEVAGGHHAACHFASPFPIPVHDRPTMPGVETSVPIRQNIR
nr:dipeptide ABC transporter ATP-binding protein [Halomonas socia]